jgi:hypothetical protein
MTELEMAAWAVIRAYRSASKINPTQRARDQMRMAIQHLALVSGYAGSPLTRGYNRRLEEWPRRAWTKR